ncbi:urate hydroxylase PuuD [Massilia pinisoli]|uniref:Urate hydroxylase PuuD n=1 Tax=Massilia pinisoli TaxID=1772194 RepID=A0ABT1ZQV8_9BURK|nr:urate hydroxylase PuuD [Massilia pinisoli]MCS0582287.1 urate hydroxylase PuuD [Massilia pinisoli]
MEYLVPYVLEWMNMLVRWLHVITGIAWIGASFYFVWLDNSLRPPAPGSDLADKGVAGELWAVHGGGFYNPQKYLVAPAELPAELHWFKWEAYSTWLSGFALLVIVYWLNAQAMMVDRAVADLAPWQAVGVGLGCIVAGWIVYDLLCRSPLGKHDLAFGVVVFALLVGAAWVLTHVLSGRAAYIHVGAMIGTIMVANVAMVIIPGQRRMVEAMRAGQKPDPVYGIRGKQRSVHNNYFTLPVLFIMISNHFAMTYRHPHAWAVLGVIMAAGVFIRHFFNLRHKGRVEWVYPAIGVALLLGLAVALAPPRPVAAKGTVDFARVQAIVARRCVSCHAAHPTQPGFASAPAGVMLDDAHGIAQNAPRIYQQAVQLKAMPLANMTGMTDAERAEIAAWFEAGATTR